MSVEDFTYESMLDGFQRRFEAVAHELGDFPALRVGETILTYKELNQRADQLAYSIQKASNAQFIITWLSDEILLITVIMAIAKLGRVWVAVNYKTPPATIAQYIQKFEDAAFFTNQSLPSKPAR
jgi:acyl-CoA synthetase (AMP-forming)/AMP-acid ligase II